MSAMTTDTEADTRARSKAAARTREMLDTLIDAVGLERAIEETRARLDAAAEKRAAQVGSSPLRHSLSAVYWFQTARAAETHLDLVAAQFALLESLRDGGEPDSLEPIDPFRRDASVVRLAVVDGREPGLVALALRKLDDQATIAARALERAEAIVGPLKVAFVGRAHGVDLAKFEASALESFEARDKARAELEKARGAADAIRQHLGSYAPEAVDDAAAVEASLHSLAVARQAGAINADPELVRLRAELDDVAAQHDALGLVGKLKGGLLADELLGRRKALEASIKTRRCELIAGLGKAAAETVRSAVDGDVKALESIARFAAESPRSFPPGLEGRLLELMADALCEAAVAVVDVLAVN